ncbi:MAG: hypothetical protein AAGN46_18740 [Acidobacteriota bacterium]
MARLDADRKAVAGPIIVLSLAVVYLLVVPLQATDEADGRLRRTVPLAADGRVEIELFAGSVEVGAWDRSEVEIEARWGGGDLRPDIEGDSRILQLESRTGGAPGWTQFTLRLPRAAQLEVDSVTGSIEVDGLRGALDLESVSGALTLRVASPRIAIEAVTGALDLEIQAGAPPARLEVESVSGPIRLAGAFDDVDLESVNGRVTLDVRRARRLAVETVSGRVVGTVEPADGTTIDIESHAGAIDLTLPDGFAGLVDLSSIVGRVATDFPADGGGAGVVRLESWSGSVRLRRR